MLFQTQIAPKQTTSLRLLRGYFIPNKCYKKDCTLRVQPCIIRTYFLIWNLNLMKMMNQTSYHSLPEYNSLPGILLLY